MHEFKPDVSSSQQLLKPRLTPGAAERLRWLPRGQCPYCIEIHSANARKAGVTDAEMVEAAMVAAALRAGAAVTHATHALPN